MKYMLNMLKKAMPVRRQGFTLIELLVVIAILGIIAVGLIIAIDPVEQVNRGTDTARRALATDFSNNVNRFFASQQYSAACPNAACATNNDALSNTATKTMNLLNATNTLLNTAGEAKSASGYTLHPQAVNLQVSISAAAPNAQATFITCWQPLSKAQRALQTAGDPNGTVWTSLGAACTPNANNTNCFQCIRQ